MFCCKLLYVNSSFAITLVGKRELVALLSLSSWCLVIVVRLFLVVPWVCLQLKFPDYTHLLFFQYPIAKNAFMVQTCHNYTFISLLLQVFDGETELGRFCGTMDPGTLYSSGGDMTVLFGSDATEQLEGFRIYYFQFKGNIPVITFLNF